MSVSVVMTCHNEGRYIAQAVRSVLGQTAFDKIAEIIIVDDGSTDGSAGILDAMATAEPQLKVLHIANSGLPAARNFGIARASGEFIALLDGDDYWVPEKLERQMPAFAAGARVGLVYSDFMDFTKDDASDAQLITVRAYHADSERTLAEYFVHDAPILPSSAIIRRAVFEDVGLFDVNLRLGEDTEMFLRIAERWRFQHVPGGLTYKRRHGANLTSRLEALLPVGEETTRRFAKRNPQLAPIADKRRARRYARTGNDCIVQGERAKGLRYLAKALRCDPLFWRTYIYLLLSIFPGQSLRRRAKRYYHTVHVARRLFFR